MSLLLIKRSPLKIHLIRVELFWTFLHGRWPTWMVSKIQNLSPYLRILTMTKTKSKNEDGAELRKFKNLSQNKSFPPNITPTSQYFSADTRLWQFDNKDIDWWTVLADMDDFKNLKRFSFICWDQGRKSKLHDVLKYKMKEAKHSYLRVKMFLIMMKKVWEPLTKGALYVTCSTKSTTRRS